jgi:hypothetical protein
MREKPSKEEQEKLPDECANYARHCGYRVATS